MSALLPHNDGPCPVLAEWSALMKRSPEEQAISIVSEDMTQLVQSLTSWIELHRRKVLAGEIPAKGIDLPINHSEVSQCIAYLSYLAEA